MQTQISKVDLPDQENTADEAIGATTPSSWICYRVVLTILVALCVSVVVFMVSCSSFKIDDSDIYYGFRGAKDASTGRCVDWQSGKEVMGWSDYWTDVRLPIAYMIGVVGMGSLIAALIAWIIYGIVLRARRRNRVEGGESRKLPIWPVVIFGVYLIGAGFVVFVSIMGQCGNIPPLSPGGLGCNMYAWSGLALASSVGLCFLGGTLACFLDCCCDCRCSRFLRKELVQD